MRYSFGDFLVNMVKEIKSDVELLGSNACKSKWEVLRQLRDRVSTLESAVEVINREYDLQVQAVPKGEKNAPEAQETYKADDGGANIALDSPVGQALLGHKVGDVVTIDVPDGKVRYAIRRIGEIKR
ncbi:MAG TPA: GreA/GreB family elongation factor [Bacillota bacterium]|nr:GreA/GreB family elongation factor [Bacillota bacterium]